MKKSKTVAIVVLVLVILGAVLAGVYQYVISPETAIGGNSSGDKTTAGSGSSGGDKTTAESGSNSETRENNTEESTLHQKPIAPEEVLSWVSGGLKITVYLNGSWNDGGKPANQYELTLENVSDEDMDSWAVDINFDGEYTLQGGWNGEYKVDGTVLHITPMDYNGAIQKGGSLSSIGFIVIGAEITE